MSKVMRSVKNVTKGYSSVQVKVREGSYHYIAVIHQQFSVKWSSLDANRIPTATSNDPWGPTGTQMSEIAQLTYNSYALTKSPDTGTNMDG